MKPHELTALRQSAEQRFGRKPKTAADFEQLEAHTGKNRLSTSTLKRIWGYNTDHTDISTTSADTLARYVGYTSYDEFLQRSSLETRTLRVIYSAAQIAKICQRIHSDRAEKAYGLLLQYRHEEAHAVLDDQRACMETKRLCAELTPFAENARTLIAEMVIKAHIEWSLGWQQEDVLPRIDSLYTQVLPLAQAINDHRLLWNIFQDWAYKHVQLNNPHRASELYEQAIRQGHLVMIEEPDVYPVEYLSSISDMAFVLCDKEQYVQALELLAEAIEREPETIVDAYVRINYARACFYEERADDAERYYTQAHDIALQLLEQTPDNHETIHALAISLYCLGYLAEYSGRTTCASEYYTEALKLFDAHADIPNLYHSHYRLLCNEHLATL